ncbi:MAG: glycosyltransferase family 4 protein [Mycobacteriaceae bacterium]
MVVHNHYRSGMPSGESSVVVREIAGLRARGHTVESIERRSDEIESWSTTRRVILPARVVWSRASRQALADELRARRPDVVHVHNTFPLLTPSVLSACTDVGVPLVVTVHNYKASCASGAFFREGRICVECAEHSSMRAVQHGCYRDSRLATLPAVAAGATLRHAWRHHVSAFILISGRQRQLLGDVGMTAERIFVKHHFVPEPPPMRITPEHAVAFLGRVDEPKGARLLMRAWDTFRARSPFSALRLDVGGSGPLWDELARWAEGRPDVRLLGVIAPDKCAVLLARSRAVLVPSEWEETFGLVAVEAMAVGTPPIAPAHGAFPEIITDGRDGVLFRPHDPDGIADVLMEVDSHPSLYHRLGIAGRTTYQRRFTADAGMDRLLDVYRFALENPVGAAGAGARPTTVSQLEVPPL